MELDEVLAGSDGSLGNRGALAHNLEALLVVRRSGHDASVVHALDVGDGRHQIGQDVGALHALAHGAAHVFGKERRGIGGLEKLLHAVAAPAADLDVKALELARKRVQALQTGAGIIFGRIKAFERTAQTALCLIHALFNSNVLKICHIITSLFSKLLKNKADFRGGGIHHQHFSAGCVHRHLAGVVHAELYVAHRDLCARR